MERIYRSRALTMPVIRLVAVSLTAVRPNKARIATPGRVAIPPPTMKPAAAATAIERSGLSRIEFSICTISRLIPNLLRHVRAVDYPEHVRKLAEAITSKIWNPCVFVHPERISVRSQTIIDRIGTG